MKSGLHLLGEYANYDSMICRPSCSSEGDPGVVKPIQASVDSGGSSDTARPFTDFAVSPDNRAAFASE